MSENDNREFNENLQILNKTMRSYWVSFSRGLLTGFGSILGAGIAIILIGWFLNVIGVIPAFQKQAEQWKQAFIQNSQTYVAPDSTTSSQATPQ